jgi:sugar-specific transcriptional regulator TrmB
LNYEEITELIVNLGLSSLEAKIYLALVNLNCGPATVRAISLGAGVVRQDTYRILSVLHNKGIVEKVPGDPAKYTCMPFKLVISKLLKDKSEKFAEIKKKSQIAMRQNNFKNEAVEPENLDFLTLANTERIISKMKAEIKKTQSIIEMIYVPQRMSIISFHLLEDLIEALDRGVDVYLVTTKVAGSQLNKDIIALHKTDSLYSNLKIRFVEDFPGVGLAIFDRSRCYIRIGQSLGHSLFTINSNIVSLANFYFSSIWGAYQDQEVKRT